MQFVVKAYDGEGMLEKRMEVRPRHLEGMKRLLDHIICAGGILDDEGKMKGSLMVMEYESRKDLDDYLENEPYMLEHVWEKVEIEPINVVIANKELVNQ
ncbi:MAG: YciI family protein [Lachnospiraceae bacterium]|nr:YciI family protein [Lachnospiraceae bacterium]